MLSLTLHIQTWQNRNLQRELLLQPAPWKALEYSVQENNPYLHIFEIGKG